MNFRPSFWLGAMSAIASGLLLMLSRDTGPIGPLVLVAPVPLLIYALTAPRGWPVAFWSLLAGWLARLSLIHTYLTILPPAVLVFWNLAFPLWFAGIILATRWLARDRRTVAALLSYPLVTTASEFLVNSLSPHGSAGSLGYALVDILPLLQLASLGGVAALTFTASFVPMALALLFLRPGHWRQIALVAGLPLVVALAFGAWRLAQPYDGRQRVALAAIDALQDDERVAEGPAAANAAAYGTLAASLAAEHPDVIVLPEKSLIRKAAWADTGTPIQDAANQLGIPIVAGFVDTRSDGSRDNVAELYRPQQAPVRYLKRRPIPGLEDGFNIGDGSLVIGDLGIAICKDMDFAPMIRDYGAGGVRLMLVPAWDFRVDARFHAEMAVVRSVENGFAMVRAAADGLLTVTDADGRWIAERATSNDQPVTLVAEIGLISARTVYTRIGDLFAWLTVAGSALLAVVRLRPRRFCVAADGFSGTMG